jgi:hypothetical protein
MEFKIRGFSVILAKAVIGVKKAKFYYTPFYLYEIEGRWLVRRM